MVNILVFGVTDNPGGMENFIMNYYRKLNGKELHFDFLCTTLTPAYKSEILRNKSKILTITKRSKNFRKFYKDLKSIFKNNRYDVFWYNECSLTNIDYLKAASRNRIKKIIVHSHNSRYMKKGLIKFPLLVLHKLHKFFIKRYATDFWSCSSDASNFFYKKSIIKCANHVIIPNAIDIDKYKFNNSVRIKYRKELKLDDFYVIGNIGRLHFQKNQEFAIRVFSALRKTIKAKLLLIGEGEDRKKLEDLCYRLKVFNDVVFMGVRNDIPNLLCAMDAFVFPSVFEGFGIAGIEAQISGLYVYNSNRIPLVSKLTDNVVFLPINNIDVWVKHILADVNKARNRALSCKQVCGSEFDIVVQAEKLKNLIIKGI